MSDGITAVAMWPTPWYLKMIGFPAWRVKTTVGVMGVCLTTTEWKYYHSVSDYANKHADTWSSNVPKTVNIPRGTTLK